jgi:hypothetical protein
MSDDDWLDQMILAFRVQWDMRPDLRPMMMAALIMPSLMALFIVRAAILFLADVIKMAGFLHG